MPLTSGTWSSGQGIQYGALSLPSLPKMSWEQELQPEAWKQGCARPTSVIVAGRPLCNGNHGMRRAPTGADSGDLGNQWRGKALAVIDIQLVPSALSRPPQPYLLSFIHLLLSFIDKRRGAQVVARSLTAGKWLGLPSNLGLYVPLAPGP